MDAKPPDSAVEDAVRNGVQPDVSTTGCEAIAPPDITTPSPDAAEPLTMDDLLAELAGRRERVSDLIDGATDS